MMYRTAEFKLPAVVNHQIDMIAATPSPTIFGEHKQTLEIVSRYSQMPAVTARPGSNQMRLRSEKPQSHKFILILSPVTEPHSTSIQDTKPVEPICFVFCIKHP